MAETTQAVEEKTEEQQNQQNQVEQEDSKAQAQSVEFSEAAENKSASIDILLDMNVSVTVAIGRTEVPIQRFLQLGPGSVLKLDKPIDTPADLYLKDIRFATGNIVVVENKFAVRIKEILSTGTPTNLKKE